MTRRDLLRAGAKVLAGVAGIAMTGADAKESQEDRLFGKVEVTGFKGQNEEKNIAAVKLAFWDAMKRSLKQLESAKRNPIDCSGLVFKFNRESSFGMNITMKAEDEKNIYPFDPPYQARDRELVSVSALASYILNQLTESEDDLRAVCEKVGTK